MVQRIVYIFKKIKSFKNSLSNWIKGQHSGEPSSSPVPLTSVNQPTPLTEEQLEITRKYDGKLLLRHEIHFNDQQFSNLLKRNYFTAHESFTKTLFTYRCLRCNNSKKSLLGYFPCATCNETHIYCRYCIMMGRVSTCELVYEWTGPNHPWKQQKQTCTWQGELTFAQSKAADAVKEAVLNQTEQLVWAVTGAGKTEILFKGIELALAQGKRICIASPRADVVRELLPRIQEAFAQVPVQGLYGKSRDREGTAQLIIATTHQLIRFKNAFDVMIIDEIDAFPYHNDEVLHYVTNRATKQISTKIYLTATPRQNLKNKLATNKLSHCFVPIRYHGNPLPVPKPISDYSLSKLLQQYELPKSFINWLDNRQRPDRQLLIFVPTIKLADQLYEAVAHQMLNKNMIAHRSAVANVHAEDPLREQKVQQFRQKKFQVLITTTILERGVTFPSIDVVVLQANHRVFDEAALVQIAGRAGRNQRDPTGEVLFFHDGKTNALVQSILSIKKMNQRGKELILTKEEVIK